MFLVKNVYAEVDPGVTNPLERFSTLSAVFGAAINIVMGVGIALTIIFLILGGIQYITSKGDQKAAQQARDWLTNAIIGFVVVIGAIAVKVITEGLLTSTPVVDPGGGDIVPVF